MSSSIKQVSDCIERIEEIQKSLWSDDSLVILDREPEELTEEIPVYWAQTPQSPPPPYWLNGLTLSNIKRELSITTLVWGVQMVFSPFLVHNYDNEAILRAAVTTENIVKAFDKDVFLGGHAHWTSLVPTHNLISVDERKRDS